MSAKTWKDHLLSSGLPLEQSVIQTLRSLGIEDPREYKYERLNEQSVPTIFSVDIHAMMIGNVWLEFFIECKYRHPGTQWVFTPDQHSISRDDSFPDTFIILDHLTDWILDRSSLDRHASDYMLCGKGVELVNNDANPKSIEQAIQQLRYALIEEAADSIIHQTDGLLGPINPIFVLVPIVVTTADLWRLKPDATVESIRTASVLDEVAEQQTVLVVQQPPDNELTRHTTKRFGERIGDEQRKNFALKNKSFFSNYNHFLSYFSSYYPAYFYVVNYNHFSDAIQKLIAILRDPKLPKKKANAS